MLAAFAEISKIDCVGISFLINCAGITRLSGILLLPSSCTFITRSMLSICDCDRARCALILRVQRCAVCQGIHCGGCLSSQPTCFDARPACVKCHALASGNYTRDYLETCFTINELRAYLNRQCVKIDNCTLKQDLIDLLMKRRPPSAAGHINGADEGAHAMHVRQLRVRILTH